MSTEDKIIRKAFAGIGVAGSIVDKNVGGDQRTFRVVASDGNVDRDGDRIEPGGWRLDAAPTCFLFSHDRRAIVGAAENLRVTNGRLEAVCRFAPPGASVLADEVCALVQAGILKSVSVGFLPIKAEPMQGGGFRIIEAELIEISWVSAPSNRGAGVISSSGGKSVNLSDTERRRALARATAAQAGAAATLAGAAAQATLAATRPYAPAKTYHDKHELLAAARDAEAAARRTLDGTAHALPMPAQSRGVRLVRMSDGSVILR
ncbi:hypothetical protein CCR97_18980 [Rhodoplanes elegans]|uniref:Prohead serine protease domain-containing protein n=1 Tax=Rhodoplanes elegans TaxID=29408 RepID=A0A327KR19_9BRAD|nr:HK97 family phage prohead protease [Rhodoplanes elegans]MBK5960269.1 hypothetical protein [Rhodoplanes elegans]RAI40717.1 hypothetical protein CH338_05365 [Rhodoplanes elegans]